MLSRHVVDQGLQGYKATRSIKMVYNVGSCNTSCNELYEERMFQVL